MEPRVLPRGGRMLFGGQAKAGKTFVMLNLLRALVLGGEALGRPEWRCRPSRVLFIEKELGPYSLGERLRNIFAQDPPDALGPRFLCMSKPRGFSFSEPASVDWLRRIIKANEIDVLALDPISKLHAWNENDNSDMSRLIGVLEEVQDDRCAIIYSHHFGKPLRGRDAEDWDRLDPYNFRGSSKLGYDDPDALMTFWRRPGRLLATHDSWALDARLTLRHGEQPPDFLLHVNEQANGRVEWRGEPAPRRRRQAE